MGLLRKLNELRKETYFAATPLLTGEIAADALTSGPATLLSTIFSGKKKPVDEDLTRQVVGRDAPSELERIDACMIDAGEKDFEMATLWLTDDLEIRILNYNPAVSVEDIPVEDVVDMIHGNYSAEDRLLVEPSGKRR